MTRRFGGRPKGMRLGRINKSPQYRDGHFQNRERTAVKPNDVSILTILKKMLFKPPTVRPCAEMPHDQINLLGAPAKDNFFVWFGHSSYFLQIDGIKILVDPILSGNISPFRIFGKAFEGTNNFQAQDFPALDLLVLTHDHYDHLDYSSIKALHPKAKNIITSLGVGAHLEIWGVAKEKIIELDWFEHYYPQPGIKITATPARHFSGRFLKRAQTLWSSFVLEVFEIKVFIGGDSGYDNSFKEIGENFGPFQFAFLECGQYSPYWPDIHMSPEQTVQAGLDLQAMTVVPVHWGKFVLSYHPWNDPINRFDKAAHLTGLNFFAPRIGEGVVFQEEYKQEKWWLFENKLEQYEPESATLG